MVDRFCGRGVRLGTSCFFIVSLTILFGSGCARSTMSTCAETSPIITQSRTSDLTDLNALFPQVTQLTAPATPIDLGNGG